MFTCLRITRKHLGFAQVNMPNVSHINLYLCISERLLGKVKIHGLKNHRYHRFSRLGRFYANLGSAQM